MSDDSSALLDGALRNRGRDAVALCYHSIAEPGPAWTSVPPAVFERQLATLRRRGFRAAGEAALDGLAAGRRPDRPLALLTFDDGYRDNCETALPLLAEYGFTGLFFLLPPFVDAGAPLLWPEVADRVRDHPEVMRSLTWAQVERMAAAGCEFGSHGLRHRHLPELGDGELREELWESRRAIADRLGRCDVLAYPFGEWSARVAEAAADAGYRWAFTLPYEEQRDATRMTIPRIAVDHRDDGARFGAKLHPLGRRLLLSPLKRRLRRLR